MAGIARPISGFVARESVETFKIKYSADELATAVNVDDIVQLMHNGYDGQPLMLVANEFYSVPIIVAQIKEVVASAVEQGYVPAVTAAHMVISQTDDGEGAVAVELVPLDFERRIPRHIKSADDKRIRAARALNSGKATAIAAPSTPVGGKYAALIAEARLRENGTLAQFGLCRAGCGAVVSNDPNVSFECKSCHAEVLAEM